MRSGRRRRLALAAALAALGACGQGAGERPAGESGWPPGTLVVARTEALAELLGRLARLGGTPLGRWAQTLAARLPQCPEVEAQEAEGGLGAALARLECRPPGSALDGLARERGTRALAFALAAGPGGGPRLRGTLALEGADATLDLWVPEALASGARALWLPGPDAAGPGVLSGDDLLLHARVRPAGGLDLAALVPAQGQGAQLFRLKSRIFSGAALDGTWELALYPPAEGAAVPRSALAVGLAHRAAALAALEVFLGEIEASWSLARSPFAVGAHAGACLLELKLLPELAPCWVATERALVVGWNPASLRKALGGGATGDASAPGRLVVELARIAEADALPWRRLVAAGERAEGAVRLRVALEGGAVHR